MGNRRRNLLHRDKLEAFRLWAKQQGYKEDDNLGQYQVLRLRPPDGSGLIVFYERLAGDHLTSFDEGTSLVQQWIREREQTTVEQ
jgi:hypothetical protein